MLVTILIPCFNEERTIEKLILKLKSLENINKQIIIIDDGSTDRTRKILKEKLEKKVDKIIFHKKNLGKGAAIISSIKFIRGQIVIIQDADLEYNPDDYYRLLIPFKNAKINVVYGSRVLGRKRKVFDHELEKIYRIFGNFILTKISNILNNQKLTDAHTCYKVFRKKLFLKLNIEQKDFSFCAEVTTKLSNFREHIIEVPVRYNGRSYKEGKKISFKDAILTVLAIIKHKLKFKLK